MFNKKNQLDAARNAAKGKQFNRHGFLSLILPATARV